jgi:dTDP-4-dehydrorhamnose reductase
MIRKKTKRVLIIGAKGMLGAELIGVFSKDQNYDVIGVDLPSIDITKRESIERNFKKVQPDIVINAAAFTDVDGCEDRKELCKKINGLAVEDLTKECNKIDAVLVHYSTDYVFAGDKKKGYEESDITNPQNQYGKSKELGEKKLQKFGKKYYLIRLSWLFGKHGKNFVDTMLKLAKERDVLEVVNDQFGEPTYAKDLAEKTKKLLDRKKPYGIYHITNEGVISWYDFAKEIFRIARVDIKIKPVSSERFPRPAKRPHYSALINTKLPRLRSWKEALQEYLESHKYK